MPLHYRGKGVQRDPVQAQELDRQVGVLRELFRNLQPFRSLYESDNVDTIIDPESGIEWCLWDIEYLYRTGLPMLPDRQWQAIELCLVRNIREAEAARMMGIGKTNPVATYATSGLQNLLVLVEEGKLPRLHGFPTALEGVA